MRSMVLVLAAAAALAACGNGSTDTGLSENEAVNADEVAEGANSFTEDQARNRLITLGYAAPTTMTMTESGAWRAVTRDPSGNTVTVLIDYRGNVAADPSAMPSGADTATGAPDTQGGATGSTLGSSGSGSNGSPGPSSPAPSGGGATPSNPR